LELLAQIAAEEIATALADAARVDGKVVLYHRESRRKYVRAEDSASDMLRSGDFVVALEDAQ
ncbi:MAG: hypothetical protein H0X64_08190, partial [Gemmatimonadaceae bacterium]|nr:hypothetical protein [Gemmatimonadaceae bacterium]